jgi:hypothetical protein
VQASNMERVEHLPSVPCGVEGWKGEDSAAEAATVAVPAEDGDVVVTSSTERSSCVVHGHALAITG